MKIGSILQLNGSARKTSELISACHLLCQLAIRKAASLKTSSVDCADCNALKNIATAEDCVHEPKSQKTENADFVETVRPCDENSCSGG